MGVGCVSCEQKSGVTVKNEAFATCRYMHKQLKQPLTSEWTLALFMLEFSPQLAIPGMRAVTALENRPRLFEFVIRCAALFTDICQC